MFYVRVATRGVKAAAQGSPRQALDYISGSHNMLREPGYSDAELAYIARMDPGWKTDLEGGRVPLVGFGQLDAETDEAKMAEAFENACVPADSRGTTGYKSITFTLPKEVSLFAEGHREDANAAMYAAVRTTLDRAFDGRRYTAVAAIHTLNEAGEIHYHAHVLVAKFAQEPDTGRIVSLNGKRGGNGPQRLHDVKAGWREGVEKEFRERRSARYRAANPQRGAGAHHAGRHTAGPPLTEPAGVSSSTTSRRGTRRPTSLAPLSSDSSASAPWTIGFSNSSRTRGAEAGTPPNFAGYFLSKRISPVATTNGWRTSARSVTSHPRARSPVLRQPVIRAPGGD